jgi:membrane-associated protease RseP (regulator of RpoE activity)
VASSLTIIFLFVILWTILNIIYREKNRNNCKYTDEHNNNNDDIMNTNDNNIKLKTYYGIFGILRTSLGLKTIETVGKYKIWQKISILLIPICIIISMMTFYMLIDSTLQLFNGTVPKESSKPVIFLFGNMIPWIPGIVALIIGITFHEMAHGIVARSFNLNIKSTGLLLALGIPLGAFVEIGDEFKNASKKVRGAIASAGPIANVIIFFIAMLITPYIYGITTPLTITTITEDYPAYGKLMEGDVIYSISGKNVNSLSDFYSVIKDIKPNKKITISILRDNQIKTIELTTSEDGKIGIIVEPSKNLMFILQTLYWTSMLNLMLGFFNLLPALPLDGFHVWNALPELIRDIKRNSKITEKISKYMEYIINERNLSSVSLMVWMIIFTSMAYSFI